MAQPLTYINEAVTHRPGAAARAQRHIRVVLTDDHPILRLGVRTLIDDQPDMRVVAGARIAEEALGYLEEGDDVAVVDYHLGGGGGGLWVTRRLKRLPIPPRVLLYSSVSDPATAVTARIAGADGLLTKGALGEQLCAAIRRLAAGGQYLPAVPAPLAEAIRSRVLPEDRAPFGMLLAGLPPEVIEQRCGLSGDQLEDRRGMILRALTVTAQTRLQTRFPLNYEQGSDVQNTHVLRL